MPAPRHGCRGGRQQFPGVASEFRFGKNEPLTTHYDRSAGDDATFRARAQKARPHIHGLDEFVGIKTRSCGTGHNGVRDRKINTAMHLPQIMHMMVLDIQFDDETLTGQADNTQPEKCIETLRHKKANAEVSTDSRYCCAGLRMTRQESA